jgi:hypothetical protein
MPSRSDTRDNISGSAAPKRRRSDYWKYYRERCHKLAPRTRDFDNHAYEDVLALLMMDYPHD